MPSAPIERLTAGLFGGLSRLRGTRIVHPHGLVFSASFEPRGEGPGGIELLRGGPKPALVRLSRALGVPEPLPDALGLAFRVPDVAEARAKLEAAGVQVNEMWDSGVCHGAGFRDPAGNAILLHHRYKPYDD